MKEIRNGAITSPLGFKTKAVCCGIKKGKPDLALIYSIVKAKSAAVFTANKIKAAHIEISKRNLKNNCAQAVIVNSGNANCGTGEKGKHDARKIISRLAECLKLKEDGILIASTGVIGKFLPLKKILSKIKNLVQGLNFNTADEVASSIMTTDTYPKQTAVEIKIKDRRVTLGAVAKGAGMICPNMATMLCFITTDADIEISALKKVLKEAVDGSFNCISVDGQMSTNDTVIILANGLAGNPIIRRGTKDLKVFASALKHMCLKLAKMIVEDGEGATKIIQVNVTGAQTKREAKLAAQSIANSPLVKTMIAGNNPNWGRILACLGAARVHLHEKKLKIFLQKRLVYRNARPVLSSNKALIRLLAKKQVEITVDLNRGNSQFSMWASDLTAEYVRINTEYN